MTGSTQPSGDATAPTGEPPLPTRPDVQVPAPPGAAPTAVKFGLVAHLVALVVALFVVAGIGYIGLVRPMMENRLWVVGACIDYYEAGRIEHGFRPAVVGCSDDRARARIVSVVGPDATVERDCEPLGSFALVDRRSEKYCIVELGQ
jgi:hypothetical protein